MSGIVRWGNGYAALVNGRMFIGFDWVPVESRGGNSRLYLFYYGSNDNGCPIFRGRLHTRLFA